MNKIKVVAKIERDVRNFFFVRLLYSFSELPDNLCTVYEIADGELLTKIINMSQTVLCEASSSMILGNSLVSYNVIEKRCTGNLYGACRAVPNFVIAGTLPQVDFNEINYLIGLISKVMIRENLGEFLVQYNEKNMSYKEFYSFQQNLSLY